MVIFKGTDRIFDKIYVEANASTSQVRAISVYGVTSYSNLANVLLPIMSNNSGAAQSTLNVNSLGAVRIKRLDDSGNMLDVEAGWVKRNQVYFVIMKDNVFLLVNTGSNSSTNNGFTISNVSGLLALTSSSTSSDISNVFGVEESSFVTSASEGSDIFIKDTNNYIKPWYTVTRSNNAVATIRLEFITGGTWYQQTYTVDSNTGLLSSVAVVTCELNIPDAENISY